MGAIEFGAENGDIIGAIQDGVKVETIKVQPDEFVTREVHFAPQRPLAKTLVVHSLTGLADYLTKKIDGESRKGIFVTVEDPSSVVVQNDVADETDRRYEPVNATADTPELVFDRYIRKEEMMIMLQSRFVENGERNELLEQLGTVVADEELRQEDDGVGQTVTTQKGIRRSEATIVNPVNLRPFRTFTEVEQPESPFIVRLKKTDDGILVALFEADGGAWRNVARQSIKDYLEVAIASGCPVIA